MFLKETFQPEGSHFSHTLHISCLHKLPSPRTLNSQVCPRLAARLLLPDGRGLPGPGEWLQVPGQAVSSLAAGCLPAPSPPLPDTLLLLLLQGQGGGQGDNTGRRGGRQENTTETEVCWGTKEKATAEQETETKLKVENAK